MISNALTVRRRLAARFTSILFLAFPLAGLLFTASAQELPGPDTQPVVALPRVVGTLHIDGVLDEPLWKSAVQIPLQDFWHQTRIPLEPTQVLAVDTGKTLAVAYICLDREIRSRVRPRDDETFWDDCVELFLGKPEPQLQESLGLEINASGSISDFRYRDVEQFDRKWDATTLRVAVTRSSTISSPDGTLSGPGWILEMELPWESIWHDIGLSTRPDRLRANFSRWNYAQGGSIFTIWSNSALAQPKPHAPARYGWLILAPEQ